MTIKTSPMGWNSWDCYGASVTEETVRNNADYMAKNLKKYGWEYVVVDIQWSEPGAKNHEYRPFTELSMDRFSRLIPAENRFPSSKGGKGFAPLGEYIHALGLKFGIHIMRGIPRQAVHNNCGLLGTTATAREIAKTASICQWNTDMYGVDPDKPGAYEYYKSIFELYASWGVDFIKCDDICREMPACEKELRLMKKALDACGRDIVFSLSPGAALPEYACLYRECANMWRITDDFWDNWDQLYDMFTRADIWSCHTGAGHWPDADMLPLGAVRQDYDPDDRCKFTGDEQRTMMTLWSIFRSPLFMGGELTKTDDFTLSLLTNEDILRMHSDARLSRQVYRRFEDGHEVCLWQAVSQKGGHYLAVFNLSDEAIQCDVDISEAELYGSYDVRELWSGNEGKTAGVLKMELPAHGAKAYYLR